MHAAIENIRQTLHFYLQHLWVEDFFALVWILLLFLVILFLVIIVIPKFQIFGSFLLFIDITFLFAGGYYVLNYIDKNFRNREVVISPIKQLHYSDTVVFDLNITNLSKKPFKICNIDVKFYKQSPNKWREQFNALTPFYVKNISFNEKIDINNTKIINVMIDNFRPLNYNTKLNSECF